MPQRSDAEIIDLVIRLAFLAIFLFLALQLISPLFGLILWAVILAVAVYPLHAWLSARLGGRQSLSALLLTLLGLAITLGPVAVLATSIIDATTRFVGLLQSGEFQMPSSERLQTIWLIGPHLAGGWESIGENVEGVVAKVAPSVLSVGGAILRQVAGIGVGLVMLSISVIIMGLLLKPGPALARTIKRFANRVFAPRGAGIIDMAGATVRNVSRGVIGVAALQALAAGIVMVGFGVPLAGPLALAVLFLGIVQVGPFLVLVAVLIWAWSNLETGMAVLFTLLIIPVGLMDNILRPIFMARGLQTPMLVILVGVLGGVLAYGLIGLFIGPVILAVFYELLTAWLAMADEETVTAEPSAAEDQNPA